MSQGPGPRSQVPLQVAPLLPWVTLDRLQPAPSLSLLICKMRIIVPALAVAMAKKREGRRRLFAHHVIFTNAHVLSKHISKLTQSPNRESLVLGAPQTGEGVGLHLKARRNL